jgi:hypothetical protein
MKASLRAASGAGAVRSVVTMTSAATAVPIRGDQQAGPLAQLSVDLIDQFGAVDEVADRPEADRDGGNRGRRRESDPDP